jgi:hypothetical protein
MAKGVLGGYLGFLLVYGIYRYANRQILRPLIPWRTIGLWFGGHVRAIGLWFAQHVRGVLKTALIRVMVCAGLVALAIYWSIPSPTVFQIRAKAVCEAYAAQLRRWSVLDAPKGPSGAEILARAERRAGVRPGSFLIYESDRKRCEAGGY